MTLAGQHIDEKGQLKNSDVSFLDVCSGSDELELFQAQAIQDLIDFKWDEFGFSFHCVASMIHAVQISILVFYVNYVYISGSLELD